MKIKLLVSRAGSDFSQSVGDEIDVADDEAIRLIEAGQAEPVRGAPVERAVKPAKGEKAAK